MSYLEHLSSLDPTAIREEVDCRTKSSKRAVQKLLQFMQKPRYSAAPPATLAMQPAEEEGGAVDDHKPDDGGDSEAINQQG